MFDRWQFQWRTSRRWWPSLSVYKALHEIVIPAMQCARVSWPWLCHKIVFPVMQCAHVSWPWLYHKIVIPVMQCARVSWPWLCHKIVIPVMQCACVSWPWLCHIMCYIVVLFCRQFCCHVLLFIFLSLRHRICFSSFTRWLNVLSMLWVSHSCNKRL